MCRLNLEKARASLIKWIHKMYMFQVNTLFQPQWPLTGLWSCWISTNLLVCFQTPRWPAPPQSVWRCRWFLRSHGPPRQWTWGTGNRCAPLVPGQQRSGPARRMKRRIWLFSLFRWLCFHLFVYIHMTSLEPVAWRNPFLCEKLVCLFIKQSLTLMGNPEHSTLTTYMYE